MNQTRKTSTFFVLLIIIFLLLQLQKSQCIDEHYLGCAPASCRDGNNVTFPFRIVGKQPEYCGSPGFEVRCSDTTTNHSIIELSLYESYAIHEFFYPNHSIKVSNLALSNLTDTNTCLPPIENLTLELDVSKFDFGSDKAELRLFYGCNQSSPEAKKLLNYETCFASETGSSSCYAMYGADPNSSLATRVCESRSVAPISAHEYKENETGEKRYLEALNSGFLLKWKAPDCSTCSESGGRCGINTTTFQFQCYCHDLPHTKYCPFKRRARKFFLEAIGIAASVSVIGTIIVLLYVKRKFGSVPLLFCRGSHMETSRHVESFLRSYGSTIPRRYSYSEIKKMTNSLKSKLGQGGYGSVYKGKLLDGRLVAVKILSKSRGDDQEFMNEVASIGRTSHVNVVTLLGYCFEGQKRALVYEFMAKGSLEKYIFAEEDLEHPKLGWETLYQIALGIARGLEYLHRGCNTRILHFDIKPHNILLDEDFHPKISDFGLAKLCPEKESIISMSDPRGTIGYIAPEVVCRTIGRVSHKSDVYSYGMMVLEIVGGRKNVNTGADRSSEIYFPNWIYKRVQLCEDPGLSGISNEEEKEKAMKMVLVSLWCIQTDPSNRPTMSQVVDMLQGSLESLQMPPRPYLSSPPRSPPESPTTYQLTK